MVKFAVGRNVLIIKFKKGKTFLLCSSHFPYVFLYLSVEAPHTSKRVSVFSKEGLHPLPEGSGSSCPDQETSVITEMFITEENIGKMENILDTWSNNLTVSERSIWIP